MTFTVRVKPNAPRCSIAEDERGYVVRIDAPPVDGEANARLVRFLAREVFGVPTADIVLVRGERGRNKTVSVDLPEDRAKELLREAMQTR